jgi:mRNA interferase MazF
MRKGEVWWVHFPSPAGRRPAVLVSRDEAYQVRSAVTVIPLTRTIRGIPTEVGLGPKDGVPKTCVANADAQTTVPKALVREHLCTLPAARVQALDRAIKFALDLP